MSLFGTCLLKTFKKKLKKGEKPLPLSAARRWVLNQRRIKLISASCYLHCPCFDTNFRIILPRLTGRLGWGLRSRPSQQRPRSVAGAGWECQSRPVCLCKPPSHRSQRLTGVSCHSSASRLRRLQRAAKAALKPPQPPSSDQLVTEVKRGFAHKLEWDIPALKVAKKKTRVVACSSNATHFSQRDVPPSASLCPAGRSWVTDNKQSLSRRLSPATAVCFLVSDLAADRLVHTPLITWLV